MAGPWLKYRGHLDNISNNMLIGAVNYFNEKTNSVKNHITGDYDEVPQRPGCIRPRASERIIVGDENYGEGSSREHAAMEPRHLGVKVVWSVPLPEFMKPTLKNRACWHYIYG